jgi:hypothetical protein
VGVLVQPRRRVRLGRVDLNPLQQVARNAARRAPTHRSVRGDALDQLVPHGEERVQGRHRVLQDHRDAAAAEPVHLGLRQRQQVDAVEADAAADDAGRAVGQHPHDREAREALAGAGFADETQGLAGVHREAHAGHGCDRRASADELHRQLAHVQHGGATVDVVGDSLVLPHQQAIRARRA